MNKKTIIILTSCFLFATVLVLALYAATYKIVHEHNSFIREYQRAAAVKSGEMDIKVNSYYIAGITRDHVYLGNVTAPSRLLITNNTLMDSQHVNLTIKDIANPTVSPKTIIKINEPYFYVADGNRPALYRGLIGEWEAEAFQYNSAAYFIQLAPISNSSFAIRTIGAHTNNNVLGKVQHAPPHLELNPNLLEKQVDGFFCTDGMLLYNRDLKRLVYTYYYRNEFIVCDTNLNLDYRGHTIDTFSRAQVKIGYITSENGIKLLDKKVINQRTCSSGNYLFVSSNLLAKNDSKSRLTNESIIDVYDLQSNTYRFSFTLPNHEGKMLRDFMVFDTKTLIALFDHYIVKYDLQTSAFLTASDLNTYKISGLPGLSALLFSKLQPIIK